MYYRYILNFAAVAASIVLISTAGIADSPNPAEPTRPAPQVHSPGAFQPGTNPTLQPHAGAPQTETNPCTRGESSITISGVDQDIQRCYTALKQQVLENLTKQLVGQTDQITKLQAELMINRSELDQARALLTQSQKDLGYYRAYARGADEKITAAARVKP